MGSRERFAPPARTPRTPPCGTRADGQSSASGGPVLLHRWLRRVEGLGLALLGEEGLGAPERGGKSCHTSRNRKKSLALCKVKFLYQASLGSCSLLITRCLLLP